MPRVKRRPTSPCSLPPRKTITQATLISLLVLISAGVNVAVQKVRQKWTGIEPKRTSELKRRPANPNHKRPTRLRLEGLSYSPRSQQCQECTNFYVKICKVTDGPISVGCPSQTAASILPSRIVTVRSPKAAASGLCVIIRMVWPVRRFRSRNIWSTASEFSVSRLPVGSSASRIAG